MKYLVWGLVIFCCSACSSSKLSVHSEYFSRQNLASSYVDTPDPRKDSTDFGQRLVINWKVEPETFTAGPLELILQIRLKNGEEKTVQLPLKKSAGSTIYPIFGKEFTKKGGLQSYFVRLESNGKMIAKSRHKLWVERIKVIE